MLADRIEIEQVTSFANSLEALQHQIRQKQKEMKYSSGLRLIYRHWEADEGLRQSAQHVKI